MKKRNFDSMVATLMFVAIATMATIGAMYLCSTLLCYAAIRDDYQFASETAGMIGWTNGLNASANSAKEALALYAESNWFAGILYSLNGTASRKFLQIVVIFATIMASLATAAFDILVIAELFCQAKSAICRTVRKARKSIRRKLRRSNHSKNYRIEASNSNKIHDIHEYRRRA